MYYLRLGHNIAVRCGRCFSYYNICGTSGLNPSTFLHFIPDLIRPVIVIWSSSGRYDSFGVAAKGFCFRHFFFFFSFFLTRSAISGVSSDVIKMPNFFTVLATFRLEAPS